MPTKRAAKDKKQRLKLSSWLSLKQKMNCKGSVLTREQERELKALITLMCSDIFFLSFWLIIQVFNLYLLPYFHFLRYSLPRCFSPSYFQVDYKKFKERIFVISFEQSGLFFRESTKKKSLNSLKLSFVLAFLTVFCPDFSFPNKYIFRSSVPLVLFPM